MAKHNKRIRSPMSRDFWKIVEKSRTRLLLKYYRPQLCHSPIIMTFLSCQFFVVPIDITDRLVQHHKTARTRAQVILAQWVGCPHNTEPGLHHKRIELLGNSLVRLYSAEWCWFKRMWSWLLVAWIIQNGSPSSPSRAGNADCSGEVDIDDVAE